jgi:DNA repair protein RadA/Sms
MMCFGEVGLTGEIRAVRHAAKRLHEAGQLGFSRCLLPEANEARQREGREIEVVGLDTVDAMMAVLFP